MPYDIGPDEWWPFQRELKARGIAPERLVSIGMGEAQPVSGNDTPEGRVANRRVEFKVSLQ